MKKLILIPTALIAGLTPVISLVGCGKPNTEKADFVCDILSFGGESLESNKMWVELNKTYTVSIDLSKLPSNKSFTGYRLEAKNMIGLVGDEFNFDPNLCMVKIDDGAFEKAVIGEKKDIIIDKNATYNKIEFIVGFQQEKNDAYLTFVANPEE